MYRSHTCGALNLNHISTEVTLSGWVQKSRDLGGMTFVDLRDRYGITQLVFNMETNDALCQKARKLGREFVIQIKGMVAERSNKNSNLATGDIEIIVSSLTIINASKTPPFTIENETDGNEEMRLRYRYLDMRREVMKNNIILRHEIDQIIRNYMNQQGFLHIETPVLIKSTPEGARDFIVPSRMHAGKFYALPQSPQILKQILMIAGFDKYYQLVKCFRDEDFRADRQPEFTQLDCEMSFVEQEDVLQTFENLLLHILKETKQISIDSIPRLTYDEAMQQYGSDKPDIRFDMKITNLNDIVKGKGFNVFDTAELVGAICVPGAAEYTRKQLDALTDFVKRPQVRAKGLVYVKCNEDGSFKSSVDKFYTAEELERWATACGANKGDLLLVISGEESVTLNALGILRLEMGDQLELRDKKDFKPLWVLDFPMFEHDEDNDQWVPMHHPFTSPKEEDIQYLESNPGNVKANAYDLVLNGFEIAGGSIRIHDQALQQKIFNALKLSPEEAQEKFGFLLDALEYGAPPHGGIAFGFDRLCTILGGEDAIREFMAFPKNNAGRDLMMEAPSVVNPDQLEELGIELKALEEAK